MKLRRPILTLAAVLAAAGLAYAYYPPFRLFTLVVAGRSPACPMRQAIRSHAYIAELTAARDRIFAASKLVESDPAGFDRWETPKGSYWIPREDKWVLPFNLAEQDVKIYGVGAQAVRSGDVVLDCGANIGVFTREALNAGASKVIAIEPAPDNLECLRRNFRAEIAAGRVVVYEKGVWDKDDTLTLNVDPHNTAAHSVVRTEGLVVSSIKVPLTTIDKLVDELKLQRVDYVKMDIEGAEPNALTGARATLERWKPRISVSAYHVPDHPARIPRIILAARPDYLQDCGPCEEKDGRIGPDILYFR